MENEHLRAQLARADAQIESERKRADALDYVIRHQLTAGPIRPDDDEHLVDEHLVDDEHQDDAPAEPATTTTPAALPPRKLLNRLFGRRHTERSPT